MKWPEWPRRLAWPIGITLFVLAGWYVDSPGVDLDFTVYGAPRLELARPSLYVALAPLSDVLDALTLLSVPGLIGFASSLLICYLAWRMIRWRLRGTSGWCEFCAGIRALLIFVLVVMLAAVLPRPMAALKVSDPDWVAFDIHSHTNFSHDARATFTVEQNRAWHRDAGFNVAYITDHRCFDGAAEGMRANPKRAGDGTVLLSGIELPADQIHVVVLERPNARVPDGLLEAWCVRADRGDDPGRTVHIQTIPEDLARVRPVGSVPDSNLNAIEISDGAPRGIAQSMRDGRAIEDLSRRFDLALVAGSNNHGWGRTAVAWNLLRVPGWRSMTPERLGWEIESRLRAGAKADVRVAYRDAANVGGGAAAMLAPLQMAIMIARSMSLEERLSWLAWTWGITAIVVLASRRVRTA